MLAENDDRCLRLTIFFNKSTSHRSAHAKQVEIVFSDVLALDELRLASRRNAKVLRASNRRHAFETVGLISIVNVVGIRDWRAQPDQTILLLHDRKRTNQNSVDDTKDRRIQTNTERE